MISKSNFFNRLPLTGLICSAAMLLSNSSLPSTDPGNILKLTIQSETSTDDQLFDMIIMGETRSHEPFHKKEKGHSTPYELELLDGHYAIVVNSITGDGKIVGKIQRFIDGQPRGSAQSTKKIMLLQVYDDGGYSAGGM